jgi:hypothetical protein
VACPDLPGIGTPPHHTIWLPGDLTVYTFSFDELAAALVRRSGSRLLYLLASCLGFVRLSDPFCVRTIFARTIS